MRSRRSIGPVLSTLVSGAVVAATLSVTGAPALAAGSTAATGHGRAPAWAAANRTGTVRLRGQVPMSATHAGTSSSAPARYLGAHAATSRLSLSFSLPLRDKAGLDALIAQEAKTHHYLSRSELYARFAPPQAQVNAVTSWLRGQGYSITRVTPGRTAVVATAPTTTVERTLSTKIGDFQRRAYTARDGVAVPSYGFYANETAPAVPANLGVTAITGLSNVARFFTAAQVTAANAHAAIGRLPDIRSGGYYSQDFKAMYDVGTHDASGQTLGYVLWGAGETQAAMTKYAQTTGDQLITVDPACTATHTTTPDPCVTQQEQPDHLVSILENGNTNGTSGTYEYAGNVETALDIESSHSVATHAGMKYYLADCSSTVPVGSGLSNATCNGSDVGMEEAVADAAADPTLHSVSNSWGYGGEVEFGRNDPFRLAVESSFQLAAAAGTTFWFSTGDDGSYESGYPADSDYVVAVGGTSLFSTTASAATNPAAAVRATATTWAAGGSWCSNIESRPSWQAGAGVTANAPCPGRVTPDISAVADPNTGFYYADTRNNAGSVGTGQVGGTSLAAPVMNGLEADTEAFLAQQTYGSGTTPAIGFEGPMIYQLGNSSHANAYFYDVVCGNTANPASGPDGDAAGQGWDPATGFGEIDWLRFSTGYAIALGATGLTQPSSIDPGYGYSCAKTPTNAAERGVSLPTNNVGYSVGSPSGTKPWPGLFLASNSWGASNLFLKTTDGGATWAPTNSDMLDVACTSASTCTEVGDGGRIRRTTDGGTTWTYVNSPFNKALTSIECPSDTICYAAGDRGTVLKSTDGGATWAYAATVDGNPIYGLSCPSTTVCYAVDLYAHVEKTTDGGATFTLMSTPITVPGVNVPGSGGPNPFAGLFGITCSDASTCVAVGGYPPVGTDPPILTTTDGGATWTQRTSNAGSGNYLNGVTCVAGTCYAVGRGGAIVTSADGGVTWTKMTSNATTQLTGITCLSATSCVATGQAGLVDVLSGGTWTPVTGVAAGNFLSGVTCLSATSCLAAGKQGATVAFDPTNVAASAVMQAGGGTTATMNALSCVDAATCVAVGTAGTIMRTGNGGQTWTSRTSGTTAALAGVSCTGQTCEAVGAVVSGAAVIVGSTDGGITWASQTSGSTSALAAVTCRTASACVAVGAGGKVITTPDGGVTWTAATSGVGTALTGVACVGTSCYAVGAVPTGGTAATVIASTDGGGTWTAQTSNAPQALSSIACTNAYACFATGAAGTVVTTVDGGTTWAQQGDPLSGQTNALSATSTLLATYASSCSSVRCVIGTASAGDIMTTPLVTVTVHAAGPYGQTPSIAGVSPTDPSVSISPASEAGNVTGTLTCSTTATASSDPGAYPVSSCSGLSDTGFSVVYDLADSDYTVGKATQSITFPTIADMTYGAQPFTPVATASSGLPVTFTASGACDVANGQVEITGAGTCTVVAHQAGNADYLAANDVTQTFQVAKADQTITFGSLDPKTFGDASFTISPTASSGLTVSVAADGACTVDPSTSPSTVTITGSGTCTVTASQAGDDDYNAAPDVVRAFQVSKANQTITFDPIPDHTYGDAPFTLDATASSGLDVTYSAAGQCTVAGDTLTITGAGSCTVTASQVGDDDYNPAADVAQTFAIAQAAQTITFPQPADAPLSQGTVSLDATASSGLDVVYTASGECSVSGHTVTLLHVGTCVVTATQPGDSNHEAAAPVTRSFAITQGAQTITFAGPADHVVGDAPFALHATATSGLDVTYTATGTCQVVGSTVILGKVGTCTVTAAQAGDDDWAAAPNVVRSFKITKATTTMTVTTKQVAKSGGKKLTVRSTLGGAHGIALTGKVTVKVTNGPTCSDAVSNGFAACTVTVKANKKLVVTVTYPGDADHTAVTKKLTVTT